MAHGLEVRLLRLKLLHGRLGALGRVQPPTDLRDLGEHGLPVALVELGGRGLVPNGVLEGVGEVLEAVLGLDPGPVGLVLGLVLLGLPAPCARRSCTVLCR